MTRRADYDTAERVSLALLTRAAFGADVGLRTADRLHVPSYLVRTVFSRFPKDTRIDIAGAAGGTDRRRTWPNDEPS